MNGSAALHVTITGPVVASEIMIGLSLLDLETRSIWVFGEAETLSDQVNQAQIDSRIYITLP